MLGGSLEGYVGLMGRQQNKKLDAFRDNIVSDCWEPAAYSRV